MQAYRTFLCPRAPGKKEIYFHSSAVGRTKLCQMREISQKKIVKNSQRISPKRVDIEKKDEGLFTKE